MTECRELAVIGKLRERLLLPHHLVATGKVRRNLAREQKTAIDQTAVASRLSTKSEPCLAIYHQIEGPKRPGGVTAVSKDFARLFMERKQRLDVDVADAVAIGQANASSPST
ncbi:MAG: hypothetical protein R3C40_10685 [Parvularculaceae bacterium]